jgi:hypothetical protein
LAASTATPAGAVGPATKLVVTADPQGAVANGLMPEPWQVSVEDASNAVVTTDSSTLTIAIKSGTPTHGVGGATLSGCQATETAGVFTITGCKIDKPGQNYQFHVTDGSLTAADTAAFNVDVIAAAGSDTIEQLDDTIFSPKVPSDQTPTTGVINIHVPNHNSSAGQSVPGDTYCNDVTYNNTGTGNDSHGNQKIVAPQNSGEGGAAAQNSTTKTYPTGASGYAYTNINGSSPTADNVGSSTGGCVDIARASSKRNSTFDNYAFGLDAVGWASMSLNAPASLTLQQVQDIWKCNYNDWSQVGGLPGKIIRALPNFGSGTRKYFINSVLADSTEGDPGVGTPVSDLPNSGTIPVGAPGAGTSVSCDPIVNLAAGGTTLEENDGGQFLSATYRDRAQDFIFPYSAGKWVQQAEGNGNPSLDKRNGVRMGALSGITSGTNTAATYPIRYLTSGDWRLNDATILPGASLTHTVSNVNASGQFDSTLTLSSGFWASTDVGEQVQGTGINDGTTILHLESSGSPGVVCSSSCDTAKISPGTSAAILNGPVTVGFAIVSEKNPVITVSQTNTEYPGVRYVFNAIQKSGNGPASSFTIARDLIGFDSTTANGFISHVCNGDHQGDIEDAGFVALPPLIQGSNTTPVTCRKL